MAITPGVYVIRFGGQFRIGFSNDCHKRIRGYQLTSGRPVTVHFIIQTPGLESAQALECRLNAALGHKRCSDGNFSLSEADLVRIETIAAEFVAAVSPHDQAAAKWFLSSQAFAIAHGVPPFCVDIEIPPFAIFFDAMAYDAHHRHEEVGKAEIELSYAIEAYELIDLNRERITGAQFELLHEVLTTRLMVRDLEHSRPETLKAWKKDWQQKLEAAYFVPYTQMADLLATGKLTDPSRLLAA